MWLSLLAVLFFPPNVHSQSSLNRIQPPVVGMPNPYLGEQSPARVPWIDNYRGATPTQGHKLHITNNSGATLLISTGHNGIFYNQHEVGDGSKRIYRVGEQFSISVKSNPSIAPLIIKDVEQNLDKYNIHIKDSALVLESF